MAKNYDIKTVSKFLHDQSTVALGSSVAAGMTRYVTFLRVTPLTVAGNLGSKVFICSTSASDTVTNASTASMTQKMVLNIPSAILVGCATIPVTGPWVNKEVQVPDTPNTEHPLFTIAASKFLTAHVSTAAGQTAPVQLFAQYFDE